MSVARDRFTFFAVMAAVGIAVFGYVRLGNLYPTQGRAVETEQGGQGEGLEREGQPAVEEAGHSETVRRHREEDPGRSVPGE